LTVSIAGEDNINSYETQPVQVEGENKEASENELGEKVEQEVTANSDINESSEMVTTPIPQPPEESTFSEEGSSVNLLKKY
jgi:hypothetical protein